ncbi:MAG TPA: hypothetical protein VN815_18370 [Steroidobacteraceae bacterium]|nr:hypothetical protein [Steroidobacteraceae bacterium]
MTPAQDATALADIADQIVRGGLHPVLSDEQWTMISAALRAVPQTPDAVREALELAKNIVFGSQFAATRERDYAKAAEYQGYIDTIDTALSTPSASAGPQAEAVAFERCSLCIDNCEAAGKCLRAPLPKAWRWERSEELYGREFSGGYCYSEYETGSDIDFARRHGAKITPLYAHPQPQQADVRPAVSIEGEKWSVRLESRPADASHDWVEIFPAQLNWVAKAGHEVRAIELPPVDVRAAVIEECISNLREHYPDHVWLNAACASLRALSQSPETGGGK